MRYYLKIIILITVLLLNIFKVVAIDKNRYVKITYIANEGYLIEKGEKKVLIDGLFGEKDFGFCEIPSKNILQNIIKGENKFADINIVLSSHCHRDHFYAPFVSKYMKNNNISFFLSTKQSIDRLKENDTYANYSKRVYDMSPKYYSKKRFEKDDIKITSYRLSHSKYMVKDKKTGEKYNKHSDIINVGFLIEIDGIKIFHSGDSSYESSYEKYNLNKEKIDIAFLTPAFLVKDKGIDIINNNLKPKNIIFMHIKKESISDIVEYLNKLKTKRKLPRVTIFKRKMDSKTFKIDY